MIHYQLRCLRDHEFDGWFRDSAAFDVQAERGLLECPTCGDKSVSRALMAPAVATRRAAPARPEPPRAEATTKSPGAPAEAVAVSGEVMPDQVRAALQRLRAEVERNCDYVGATFAEEARRRHHGEGGERQRRGIYGEATTEQAETLAEEGIKVARIPWVPRADG